MRAYRTEFIELALEVEAIQFGEFKLKSGRISPYFFNSGKFGTGYAAAKLGRYYADAAMASDIEFDMLFGPAYKGIPLVTITAAALAEQHGVDLPFCFNRKEAKLYGDGGEIVGSPIEGRVLIIDDVITAGTATRDAIAAIRQAGGEPAGALIALDRQEKGTGDLSAVQEAKQSLGVEVTSIIRLDDLIAYLETAEDYVGNLEAVAEYRHRYGV
ncbi:MAG: orotate phosphoribosyltransferase [Gammaproteobacteria bacterium]|nr:orotate phosphoribosyltransferase [Gammaproteobacteria bacterium]